MPVDFDEGSAHAFWIGEPYGQRNLLDWFTPVLQTQTRRLNSQALDRFGRRFTRFSAECSSELS